MKNFKANINQVNEFMSSATDFNITYWAYLYWENVLKDLENDLDAREADWSKMSEGIAENAKAFYKYQIVEAKKIISELYFKLQAMPEIQRVPEQMFNIKPKWLDDFLIKEDDKKEEYEAEWLYWPGWSGNHDKRIDDATCSNCGYKHLTVYNTPDNLSDKCPRCQKKMRK